MEAIIAFQFLLILGLFVLLLMTQSQLKRHLENYGHFLDYFRACQRFEADQTIHLFERIRAVESKQRNQEVTWQ